MAARLQRKRRDVSADQRLEYEESLSIFEMATIGLDWDERLVTRKMYLKNRKMYDQINSVAYLIRGNDHPNYALECVTDSQLEGMQARGDNNFDVMLSDLFIVRLRLPWNETRYEWFISQQELDENRKDYKFIDIILRVRDKNGVVTIADPLKFEKNRDEYEVLEARYLVCWRPWLPVVDPDKRHVYIEQ